MEHQAQTKMDQRKHRDTVEKNLFSEGLLCPSSLQPLGQ